LLTVIKLKLLEAALAAIFAGHAGDFGRLALNHSAIVAERPLEVTVGDRYTRCKRDVTGAAKK
jgi:hypothetical protein